MKRLADFIASFVASHVTRVAKGLRGEVPEYRASFCGPPMEALQLVFQILTAQDECIKATLSNGNDVRIPVMLPVDPFPADASNPEIGVSGSCTTDFLTALRNSQCLIYVVLVPPGKYSNQTKTSTWDDFGLSSESKASTASISQWWKDDFIQQVVAQALGRHWPTNEAQEDAKQLVESAVVEADVVEQRHVNRRSAWAVLSRVWSVSDPQFPFGTSLSLATGYPPMTNGDVDFDAQTSVLKTLAARFEEENIRQGIERIKEKAKDDEDRVALDQLLSHLQQKCDMLPALGRSISYFYGPFAGDEIEAPPFWWKHLTVERWAYLLDEEGEDPPNKMIRLECLDPVITRLRGVGPVVVGQVTLRASLPSNFPSTPIVVTRDVGGASNHREWRVTIKKGSSIEITDDSIPTHKTPIRYSAAPVDPNTTRILKSGRVKVISLSKWEPGLVMCSHTAYKGSAPKPSKNSREKIAFELTLWLTGQGRHYVDVYLGPNVTIASDVAYRSNEQGIVDKEQGSAISKITESEYGVEVEVTSTCFYQFEILRPEKERPETVRVDFSADEIVTEACESEFERLIFLNTQCEGRRTTTDIYVNRQQRCADLQVWMLDKNKVKQSFYPMVFARDYASNWRMRDWTSSQDTVLSEGTFLHDPRPLPNKMQPPEAFISAREALAQRIRGDNESGLAESARLGQWLVEDPAFGELVECYVRTYQEWLASSKESAVWCDISIITRFEPDGGTLIQEPDAILVSPLHPIRLAWHCLAQRALFLAQRKRPCPAASILDPNCIPDVMVLPLHAAAGGIKWQVYFSVECSSDYWGILWNASRLDRLAAAATDSPFNKEFGILVGGVSSGFNVSQVHRALDDVSEMLVAKPVINVLVTSASGQNNACNKGIISWCRKHFSLQDDERLALKSLGRRFLQILDDRKHSCPEDAEISNLAEDTGSSVTWYAGVEATMTPDLGIITQLETSNAEEGKTTIDSPLGYGGLIRGRIRQQLKAGAGALLSESRMGRARPASGDGLADKTMAALVLLENIADIRSGYVFAPSVRTIKNALEQNAEFVAVSSSAVDPACFLGNWLEDTYLWDYQLPSYSNRAGDSNGYYLLSRIKALDRETLAAVLSRLPGCQQLADNQLDQIILEVARRGIPTVRGLSGGDLGASGDLGLFIASRILQDAFRTLPETATSLFSVWTEEGGETKITLVVPIDPFKGYLDDLTRALKKPSTQRPDLLVAGIYMSGSRVACKLTSVEVKYRSAREEMSPATCREALQQAKSLSALFEELNTRSDEPEMILWKLAFQHLLASILGYGFRVYSQQTLVSNKSEQWAEHQMRLIEAIFSEELKLEVDEFGRLIVIDGSPQSTPRDSDSDKFFETIILSHGDASSIVKGQGQSIYNDIRGRIGSWGIFPQQIEVKNLREVDIDHEQPVASPSGGTGVKKSTLPVNFPTITTPTPQDSGASEAGLDQGTAAVNLPLGDQALAPSGTTSDSAEQAGIEIMIGDTIEGFRQETRRLNLGDTNLSQLNIGVVGDLGTGKTQLLKSLVYQISQAALANRGVKPRFLIFDYKKDYIDPIFVQAVGAKVVTPQNLPINLFDLTGASDSMTPWLDRFKFFADVLDKIYPGIGAVQRDLLRKAIKQAYDQYDGTGRAPTIYDIHAKYHSVMAGRADSITSILNDMVDMQLFTPTPTSVESIDAFLDGVVVISLAAVGQDDKTKNMLVAIMLNIFYEHMLKMIPKRGFAGPNKSVRVIDSFLLIDEADNVMQYEFSVLRKILLQDREFGVGVILASQYLNHFKARGTDYREPLKTWFIHNVPNVIPQELGALGLTGNLDQQAGRIKTLTIHECLYKTHNGSGEFVKGMPFFKLIQ